MTFILAILTLVLFLIGILRMWTLVLERQAETSVPRIGKTCPVPDGSIHYVDLGATDKPVLVILHGLAGQLQHGSYALTDQLSDEFRIILLDRPGCGYSTRDSAANASLTEQAWMVWAFLDKIGVENPTLVGHSLGGALALQMALDRPQATGGIALLAPVTRPVTKVADLFKPLMVTRPWLRACIGNVLSGPVGKFTADKVLQQAFDPELCPQDFMIRGGAMLGLRPKGFISASEDLMMMPDAMQALSARYTAPFPVPGGVLYGLDDAVLPEVDHGRPMADYGLLYETLPGRGHMLPMLAPRECAAFIRKVQALATPRAAI